MNQRRMLRGHLDSYLVEHRARRINDPIERLRYLQQIAKRQSGVRSGSSCVYRHWKVLPLFVAFLGLRMQTVSDASMGFYSRPPAKKVVEVSNPIQRTAVWRVEGSNAYEEYSNGLRIENRYRMPNRLRSYVVCGYGSALVPTGGGQSQPVGIVFHTTESPQVPFEATQNSELKITGEDLLQYVRSNHSYHFVIDRFGRVFRVVPETDAANHAGGSVWADARGVYVGLNDSFLGIAFEAHTRPTDDGDYLSPAQIHSGRLLVQMLLDRYRIPLTNCVTHAQVSVNPDNMRIGYHTDGSVDFPFQDLGLPDNYSLPLPSVFAFGFDFDLLYLKSTGSRLWKGLLASDERFRQEAAAHQIPLGQYRKILQERFRTISAALRKGASEERRP